MLSSLPKGCGEGPRQAEVATAARPYSKDRPHTLTERTPGAIQLSSRSTVEGRPIASLLLSAPRDERELADVGTVIRSPSMSLVQLTTTRMLPVAVYLWLTISWNSGCGTRFIRSIADLMETETRLA